MRRPRRLRRHGQAIIETVILIAALLLATAWAAMAFPEAIKSHYETNRNLISAPI